MEMAKTPQWKWRKRLNGNGENASMSLAVVVGKSGLAYRRPDGVYVVPLTALKP